MGVRVTFYLGTPGGLEGLFWGATPQSFLDWARDVEREFQGLSPPKCCIASAGWWPRARPA
jgi:hypothetical protein